MRASLARLGSADREPPNHSDRRLVPSFAARFHRAQPAQRHLMFIIGLCTVAILSVPVLGAITLDADFDSGSLCMTPSSACHIHGVASSVSGNFVSLVGRDNFNTGQWKWLYFAADGVAGQPVTFQINDDFNTGGSNLNLHEMVYSYDQENWQFFDNNVRNAAQDSFTFSNDSPFTQDRVYVAYGLPYPFERMVAHTTSIATSRWALPTASADASFVIGHSPGGVDDIGRNIAPRNLYGYTITDPEYAGPKKRIVLLSGVHANETVANHTLEGLVDFLVSDELEAAQLRRYAEFYIYPMANPDGRYAGYNRTTVQADDIDPNRAWNPPTYREPGDDSTLEDIRQVGEAMRRDTGGEIDYLIDFHSTVNHSIPYHHGLIRPEWQSDPFWLAMREREPAVITAGASLVDYTGAKFGRDVLGADFSATFETLFIGGENEDRFENLGRNFGLAWNSVFAVGADLNFDGELNIVDWLRLVEYSETDLGGLSAIERYERGDLDGDGANSIADFALFKGIYEEMNGDGSFSAMLEVTPESATLLYLAIAGSFVTIFGRPVRHLTSTAHPFKSSTRTEGLYHETA